MIEKINVLGNNTHVDPFERTNVIEKTIGGSTRKVRSIDRSCSIAKVKRTFAASMALPMNTVEPNPTAPCKG